MKTWTTDTDAFDQICGDCCGVDVNELTEEDVRRQAAEWTGEDTCPPEMVEAAVRGLAEYQS